MKKVVLGHTGAEVSAISLGAWSYGGKNTSGGVPVGWSGQEDTDSKAALRWAYELDINHWDTADVYGDGYSEKIIGSMWPDIQRNQIFLATKFGWDQGPHEYWYHPGYMRQNMERSLNNLNTDFVDLLYLHHCNFGKHDEYFDDAMETVHRFQDEGKTRFIGLSDWSSKKIMKFIQRANPDVIQPLRNVYNDTYVHSGLKEYVDTHNLGICFFSPIKHGLLTGKYDNVAFFPDGDFRQTVDEFQDIDFINKMQKNKALLKKRFVNHAQPVLHGLLGALLTGCPTGCVLLGLRNKKQVFAANNLGQPLNKVDAGWVFSLYKK